MKYLFLLLLPVFGMAQSKSVKDTVSIDTARIPQVIETNMIARENRIAEIKKEIESLQKQNKDDYTAILQFNNIAEERIIGPPEYKPGKLIFKLKPK